MTLDFGTRDTEIAMWTTPGATGAPTGAEVVPPTPTRPGQPFHLLARTPRDGALLVSLVDQAEISDSSDITATLRRHPDRNGNPTGPEAESSQTTCAVTFEGR